MELGILSTATGRALIPAPTPESKRPALKSVYAIGKYVQERLTLTLTQQYGMEGVALRLWNVYGSGQSLSNPYTGVLAIFASRIANGQRPLIFEDGRQRRDFVHVDDVVEIFHARAGDAGGGRRRVQHRLWRGSHHRRSRAATGRRHGSAGARGRNRRQGARRRHPPQHPGYFASRVKCSDMRREGRSRKGSSNWRNGLLIRRRRIVSTTRAANWKCAGSSRERARRTDPHHWRRGLYRQQPRGSDRDRGPRRDHPGFAAPEPASSATLPGCKTGMARRSGQ